MDIFANIGEEQFVTYFICYAIMVAILGLIAVCTFCAALVLFTFQFLKKPLTRKSKHDSIYLAL
jgi:hypothetical protein